MKKIIEIKKFLGLFGLLVLIYLVYRIGFKEIVSTFIGLKIYFLLTGLPFLFLCFVIWSYRLKYLLDKKKFNLSFSYIFKIYFIGNFYSTVTPSQIGGVVMKTFYIKEKASKTFAQTAGVVVLDKILEIIALLFFGIIGSFILFKYLSIKLFIMAILMFISFILVLILLIKKKWGEIFFRLAYKFIISQNIKKKAKLSFKAFYQDLPTGRVLVLPLILAILGWLILYSFTYFLGLSLEIKISYLIFIVIMAISSLVGLLPISFGGLGTREGTTVFLLGIFNVGINQAFTLSILGYLIAKFLPALVGSILTLVIKNDKQKSKKDISNFA